jgi:cell division protein FtsB
MVLFQGCAKDLLSTRISAAEEKISRGKASEVNLKEMSPVLPPSLAARHKLALVMDSIARGDFTYAAVKADLLSIRDGALTPGHLSVEAGYLLTLVERLEKSAARTRECSRDTDELKKDLDQSRRDAEALKKENEELKKEVELQVFKLKKLEEIHIDSVKRRGKQ